MAERRSPRLAQGALTADTGRTRWNVRQLQRVQVTTPTGLDTVHGYPHFDAFASEMEGALQAALKSSRELAGAIDAGGFQASNGNAHLTRRHASILDARLSWWAGLIYQETKTLAKTGKYAQPDWEAIHRDLISATTAAGQAIMLAMDDVVGRHAVEVLLPQWPVLTGLSRASLYLDIQVDAAAPGVVVRLGCSAPYTPYIRQANEQGSRFARRASRRTGYPVSRYWQDVGGKKRFNAELYNADLAAAGQKRDPLHKTAYGGGGFGQASRREAQGHPYQDLIRKPGATLSAQVGERIREITAAKLGAV